MTEMQFTNADEALEFLREQLSLATELTIKLMEQVDRLQPDKFNSLRAPNPMARPHPSRGPEGKAAKRAIFRVIQGGLSKDAD